MVKKVDKEKECLFCSNIEILKVNENKAMILMNCYDLEKFGSMIEQPELKKGILIITVLIQFMILNLLNK